MTHPRARPALLGVAAAAVAVAVTLGGCTADDDGEDVRESSGIEASARWQAPARAQVT